MNLNQACTKIPILLTEGAVNIADLYNYKGPLCTS